MTDNDRKIDAFRLLYGAVTLPFGGVIGALLAHVGEGANVAARGSEWLVRFPMLAFSLVALFLFFAAIPVACEGIIRRRLPPGRWAVPLVAATVVLVALIMPSDEFGIERELWLAVISAWLIVVVALCALCRFANVKRSVLR